MNDLNRGLAVIAEHLSEAEDELRSLSDAIEASRILRERDDELRYEHEYGADAYGGPRALGCGCRPGRDCDWHKHVALFADIETSYWAKPIPSRCFDWSATRKGVYDGAPDAKWPSNCQGFGPDEASAIADLLDQEQEAIADLLDKETL